MGSRKRDIRATINTDEFLDMPAKAQLLYFHLAIRADKDGLVSNPKSMVKILECEDEALDLLASSGYVSYISSSEYEMLVNTDRDRLSMTDSNDRTQERKHDKAGEERGLRDGLSGYYQK